MPFYYNNKGNLDGLLVVYEDDTLATRLKTFEKPTDMIPIQLESKPKELSPVLFAEINITSPSDGLFVEMKNYI